MYILKLKTRAASKQKQKPIEIEDIIIGQDKLQLMQEFLEKYGPNAFKLRFTSSPNRSAYLCATCNNIALKNVYFRKYDMKIVERYCDACYAKEGFE
jgi:hypothetical protein